jgi:hypothetical protein
LNNITGDLKVTGRTTTQALTVGVEAIIGGVIALGTYEDPSSAVLIYSPLVTMNDASLGGNLTVNGNVSGKIDASNITSGTIDSARLPSSQVNSFTYGIPAGSSSPNWCRIMTINITSGRFSPFKFSVLGSRPASGWPPYFDEDYYIQFRRDTTTADLSDTYYYFANRRSNFPCGDMKLNFVRTSFNELDVYLYRDHNYAMSGSILFNKLSTAVIITYNTEPVLTTAPENSSSCPVRCVTVPTPPATGTYTLKSNNGTLSWVLG